MPYLPRSKAARAPQRKVREFTTGRPKGGSASAKTGGRRNKLAALHFAAATLARKRDAILSFLPL